jgi:hypothetical protein
VEIEEETETNFSFTEEELGRKEKMMGIRLSENLKRI